MSNRAIQWALAQRIKPSGAKFVLVVLADMVRDVECQGWPPLHAWGTSLPRLAELTAQDDKTVRANLQRLVAGGYIEEAGKAGRTGQVNVYRVLVGGDPAAVDAGADQAKKATESGILQHATKTTETGTLSNRSKATESGSLARNERLPISAGKTPVFPAKDSQFRPERLPKTGDETLLSPVEPKGQPWNTSRVRARKPTKVPLPSAFAVSESVAEWAAAKGFGDLDRHLEAFVGKAQANGYQYADWDAAFRNAVRDDWAGLRSAATLSPGARAAHNRIAAAVPGIAAVNAKSSADGVRQLLKQGGLFGGVDAALPLVERLPEDEN